MSCNVTLCNVTLHPRVTWLKSQVSHRQHSWSLPVNLSVSFYEQLPVYINDFISRRQQAVLLVPHVINPVPMQHSDVYLICVGYYSRSTFNVMACNTLHKPTPQRELAMVSKFTPVASHLTLSYICSRFYDFVTLYFGWERQESNEIAVWTIRYSAAQFDNNLIEFKAWFCNVYPAPQKLNYSHSRLLVISLRSLCTWYSL